MKKRYQVFISSTFQDLQPARREVSDALLRSDCFPAGMELFPAADEEQFSYIKEVIDESDYYIIISAGRYGSIDPKTGYSYTEMEYDYAVSKGKPIIRLVHADPFNDLRGEYIEKTDSGREKLEAFRSKLKTKLVRLWKDSGELGAAVVHGIEDAKRRTPAGGWIHASAASSSYGELLESITLMGKALRADVDAFLGRFPYPALRTSAKGEIIFSNLIAKNFSNNALKVGCEIDKVFVGLSKSLSEILSGEVSLGTTRELVKGTFGGEEKFFEISVSGRDDLDGSYIIVLNDYSGLKTLESQFIQSQKMQAIGQLAGGVAHDFNNLLTAISGHCDLLLLHHEEDSPDYKDLAQIRINSNRAAALVGQLLAFSRKQTLMPEVVDVFELMTDLGRLLNRLVGERVNIRIENSTTSPYVRVDRRQFEQVIMNLVVNARDAMPEGGNITVGIESVEFATSFPRSRASVGAGKYVRISVADEGIGISAEKIDRVFEPFYTTKRGEGGTGLGLSTAYGIVKQSGGYIFVDSIVGKGTVFEVFFRECEKAPSIKEDKEIKRDGETKLKVSGTLLFVEDDAAVREFCRRALELRGYNVVCAENGEDALRQLKGIDSIIDAFITDVVMPVMDGPTWVREALKDRPGTPVLFVSGYPTDDFSESMEGIRYFGYLPKPFSLSELAGGVASLIDSVPNASSGVGEV